MSAQQYYYVFIPKYPRENNSKPHLEPCENITNRPENTIKSNNTFFELKCNKNHHKLKIFFKCSNLEYRNFVKNIKHPHRQYFFDINQLPFDTYIYHKNIDDEYDDCYGMKIECGNKILQQIIQ
jgi:hypothetical protein